MLTPPDLGRCQVVAEQKPGLMSLLDHVELGSRSKGFSKGLSKGRPFRKTPCYPKLWRSDNAEIR
jgi:hypothetical protein